MEGRSADHSSTFPSQPQVTLQGIISFLRLCLAQRVNKGVANDRALRAHLLDPLTPPGFGKTSKRSSTAERVAHREFIPTTNSNPRQSLPPHSHPARSHLTEFPWRSGRPAGRLEAPSEKRVGPATAELYAEVLQARADRVHELEAEKTRLEEQLAERNEQLEAACQASLLEVEALTLENEKLTKATAELKAFKKAYKASTEAYSRVRYSHDLEISVALALIPVLAVLQAIKKVAEAENAKESAKATGQRQLTDFFSPPSGRNTLSGPAATLFANLMATYEKNVGQVKISEARLDQCFNDILGQLAQISTNPLQQIEVFRRCAERLEKKTIQSQELRNKIIEEIAATEGAAQHATAHAALKTYCRSVRPDKFKGCFTQSQRDLLYPIAFHLCQAGATEKQTAEITGLGRRAMEQVKALRADNDGVVLNIPTRAQYKAKYGAAIVRETANFWEENTRESEGKKNSLKDPSEKRRKVKSKRGVDSVEPIRHQIRWFRGTYIALYGKYVKMMLGKRGTGSNEATPDSVAFVIPSYSWFMNHKPWTVRREKDATCLCADCLQVDLMSAAVDEIGHKHRNANPDCKCLGTRLVGTARLAEEAFVCPKVDPAPHTMFKASCVYRACDTCAQNPMRMGPPCPNAPSTSGPTTATMAGPTGRDGATQQTPVQPTQTAPPQAAPAPGPAAAAAAAPEPTPAGHGTQPNTDTPILLCPGMFRASNLLVPLSEEEQANGGHRMTSTVACTKCDLPRPPRDCGDVNGNGLMSCENCRCDAVEVALQRTINYKTKEGVEKSKKEFATVQMTPDELYCRFSELMVSYLAHKDKARVCDAESRQYADAVPVHSIHTIMDFSENGSLDPRAEWVARHWTGGTAYTIFPVCVSADIDTFTNVTPEQRQTVKDHLESIGAPSNTIKEMHFMITNDLQHDFAAVRAFMDTLNDHFSSTTNSAPYNYARDDDGFIKVSPTGDAVVTGCDCTPETCRANPTSSCECSGEGSCVREHRCSTDGCACQFRSNKVHRWISSCAHEGRRRVFWLYKAPGTSSRRRCAP